MKQLKYLIFTVTKCDNLNDFIQFEPVPFELLTTQTEAQLYHKKKVIKIKIETHPNVYPISGIHPPHAPTNSTRKWASDIGRRKRSLQHHDIGPVWETYLRLSYAAVRASKPELTPGMLCTIVWSLCSGCFVGIFFVFLFLF